jgi:hypothetical protein
MRTALTVTKFVLTQKEVMANNLGAFSFDLCHL